MDTLFIVLSASGVITSLIFIFYLLGLKKGNLLANKLLGVLFLFLTIRVGKATLYYYFELNEMAVYFGLAAFLGIGPVSYLYFKVVLKDIRKLPGSYYLHLLPPLIILIIGFLLSAVTLTTFQPYLYQFILMYFLIYLGLCLYFFFQHNLHKFKKVRKGRARFLRQLLGAVSLIYIIYAINWFVEIDIYVFGGLFYFVIIYLFLYKSLTDHSIYHKLGKANEFQYINTESGQVEYMITGVDQIMRENELYLNPSLKIDEIAHHLGITRHQLSELINSIHGQGFPAFVNTYRLEHAKKMLIETENNVSEIAYASGFNTISTFNSYFKKKTGLTPTEFRKKKK